MSQTLLVTNVRLLSRFALGCALLLALSCTRSRSFASILGEYDGINLRHPSRLRMQLSLKADSTFLMHGNDTAFADEHGMFSLVGDTLYLEHSPTLKHLVLADSIVWLDVPGFVYHRRGR